MRSLYRPGSLTTVVRDLAKCRLDLVDVWEVRWNNGGTVRAENYSFFSGNGNKMYLFIYNLLVGKFDVTRR